MISNVSTPLLGVVDTAIMGQITNPAYIGAVAVGAMFFNLLFWGFGFLRMGTTSLTAQAMGADNSSEVTSNLVRALIIALLLGSFLVMIRTFISEIGFKFVEASDLVKILASNYFEIRIVSAPAAFINFALIGWFIGIGRARLALTVQITLNLLNAVLDWHLVMNVGLGVKGVAIGTVTAEYVAATIGLVMAWGTLDRKSISLNPSALLNTAQLHRLFQVSKDIMLRSFALMFVFTWFTLQGARGGDLILAANAILMQFITTTAYFLDGFAIAAETLVGRAIGALNRKNFIEVVRITTIWGASFALIACVIILFFGPLLIHFLTINSNVRELAKEFLFWAAFAPVIAIWCYQLDGIFIGSAWTQQMVKAMFASTLIFLFSWWITQSLGNTGLWIAIYIHYLARGMSLAYYYPKLLERSLPQEK